MTTTQRLGLSPLMFRGQDQPPARVPVYVVWCDGLLETAIEELAADVFTCPSCAALWPLQRPGGILLAVRNTPNCSSVSDSCGSCGAELHVDNTAAEWRAALRWPMRAVEIPEEPCRPQ